MFRQTVCLAKFGTVRHLVWRETVSGLQLYQKAVSKIVPIVLSMMFFQNIFALFYVNY